MAVFASEKSGAELQVMRRQNNPNNEPTGDFTRRCSECGSKNLWDDNLAYGCNDCGAILRTG
jgi:DNA-directed RNA polymerase subunit RPC12/RpoP